MIIIFLKRRVDPLFFYTHYHTAISVLFKHRLSDCLANVLFFMSAFFIRVPLPEGPEYEYSGSEDEDDEVTEEEGEPR